MRRKTASHLAGFIVRGWWGILTGALVVSLLSIPVVQDLPFGESVLDLFPQNSQVVRDFSLYMRFFGKEDALVALLECEDSGRLLEFAEAFAARLRTQPLLKTIQFKTELVGKEGNPYNYLFCILSEKDLEWALERLSRPGLERSILSLKSFFFAPSLPADRRFLTLDPLGLLNLLAEHQNSLGIPIDPTSGYFLSKGGTALLIILRPVRSSYEIPFNKKIIMALREVEEEVRGATANGADVVVSYTGSYVYAFYFARWLKLDFVILSTISLIGLLILFYWFYRKVIALPLILLPLAGGILWTLALAGLIVNRLNMVSVAFSAILLGLGIDIGIHFFARFREEAEQNSIRISLENTFSNTGRAVITAVTTTAFVFFVFALSSFRGIAELGMLCGLGMVVNLATMLLVFPSLLVGTYKSGALRFARHVRGKEERTEAILRRFYPLYARKITVVAVLILLPLIWLSGNVEFEQDIQSLEPRDMPPSVVKERIQTLFEKQGLKLMVLIRDRSQEKILQKSDSLKEELQAMVEDGTIVDFDSLSKVLPSVKTQERNLKRIRDINLEKVISDMQEIMLRQGFRLEPFSTFFHDFREAGKEPISIDRDLPEGLRDMVGNYLRMEGDDYLLVTYLYCDRPHEIMRAYHRLASSENPWRQEAILTGFPLVQEAFGNIVRRDFVVLSIVSIIGLLGILLLHFRDWRIVLVILVPLFYSAVSFLAFLSSLGISINLFNLIVIPLIFGIGLDDHVYILHRYLEHQKHDAIGRAVYRSGRAVILTSMTTIIGFGSLIASRFDGLVLLGSTAVIGIAVNLLSSLVVMPCLIILLLRSPSNAVS